jgi:outer membrane protein assembly factor BamB
MKNISVLIVVLTCFLMASSVLPAVTLKEDTFFVEHRAFNELTFHSLSKESQSPQTTYYMNPAINGNKLFSPILGPMNSSWPMSCHDLRHTSQSPYSTANNTGIEIWRFRCGVVDGGPIIGQDGTIYFGDEDWPTYLYALHPDGSLKWKFQLDDIWTWLTPAIAEDGTIYTADFEGTFYAVKSDGTLRWKYHIPGGNSIASSPAIAPDGTVYFDAMMGDDYGYIYAMNPNNGTVKWRYYTDYWMVSGPAIGPDGTIYVGSCDHYLYAMNPNGTLKWRFHTGDIVKSYPSIATDGIIYFTSFDGNTYALNPDGTVKWTFSYCGSGCNAVTIASDGTLYIAGDKIYALHPNGTVRWMLPLQYEEHVVHSSPAISADGTIYVGTMTENPYSGRIVVINPDGTERWRKTIANELVRSSPAIAPDGTVYIGSSWHNNSATYGYMHAFGIGPLNTEAHGPYSCHYNHTIQLQGDAFGGTPPYTYHWDLGDGTTSDEQNPSHTYTTADCTATLTATDSEGNTSSDTASIHITYDQPKVSITKPTKGLYFRDVLARPLKEKCIIIGPITIEAEASQYPLGIERVEFLIDGTLKYTDVEAPYAWTWKTPAFFKHTITVIAYDASGQNVNVDIQLTRFF